MRLIALIPSAATVTAPGRDTDGGDGNNDGGRRKRNLSVARLAKINVKRLRNSPRSRPPGPVTVPSETVATNTASVGNKPKPPMMKLRPEAYFAPINEDDNGDDATVDTLCTTLDSSVYEDDGKASLQPPATISIKRVPASRPRRFSCIAF